MSFTTKITFTGVCEFVPNAPFDQHPTEIRVLFPNGERQPLKGADADDLARHRAFVRFNTGNLLGFDNDTDQPADAIWYLGRLDPFENWELTFDCPGTQKNLPIGDLRQVPELGEMAPDFSKLDSMAVRGNNPSNRLIARAVIDRGYLHTGNSFGPWVVPNVLCKTAIQYPFIANEVILDIPQCDEFTIVATPLPSGTPMRQSFQGPADSSQALEITIANLCDVNPLQWTSKRDATPDRDFKWHFELLEPNLYVDLKQRMMDLGLELPFPIPKGKHGGRGINCFPVAVPPVY